MVWMRGFMRGCLLAWVGVVAECQGASVRVYESTKVRGARRILRSIILAQ